MGIPYYFFHLTKKYKNIILSKLPTDIYIYAIDFNGIIHPEAHKLLKSGTINKQLLFKNLWNKILNYSETYKPTKTLICIDGVAPLAKILFSTIEKSVPDKDLISVPFKIYRATFIFIYVILATGFCV